MEEIQCNTDVIDRTEAEKCNCHCYIAYYDWYQKQSAYDYFNNIILETMSVAVMTTLAQHCLMLTKTLIKYM